jgi:hypothetical protein
VVEVPKTQTLSVGLLWTRDQPVSEAATYTTQNKHKVRISTPSIGFEPAIPEIDKPQNYRGAEKSLTRPGRTQATATEDYDVQISCL